MRFFNVNKAKKIVENTARAAIGGYAISMPFVVGYSIYRDGKKRDDMIKKYPGAHYEGDDVTCRGWIGTTNDRMVDNETGKIVARFP